MPSHGLTDEKRRHLVEFAKVWGEMTAEKAYGPEGPGLDVDLAGLEEIAVELQHALLIGFCEVTTRQQAGRLPETLSCPDCGRECAVSIILRNQSLTAPRREARDQCGDAILCGARLNWL